MPRSARGTISEKVRELEEILIELRSRAVEGVEEANTASSPFTSRTLSTTSRCASNAVVARPKMIWLVNCEVAYTTHRNIHQKIRYGAPKAFAKPRTVTWVLDLSFDPCRTVEISKQSGLSHHTAEEIRQQYSHRAFIRL